MAQETKKQGLLSHGLFAKPLMDSRIKTRSVSKAEMIFGHLIGPLGLIFVVNTIAALVEKFFTQQCGVLYGNDNVSALQNMGNTYEIVMTVGKVLAIFVGILNSLLISKTECRQGRFRPWYLISGFISIAIGFLIFLFPGATLGKSYWYYFFVLLVCYHTVGSSFFFLFRDNICSVSTMDPKEKTQLQFIRKMSWTLISGILIGMLISSVALPLWLEKDIHGYAILMIGLSLVAIPLVLMEYFFTKERVIEDYSLIVGESQTNRIPLKDQMKALLTNRYFLILFILTTISGIVDNFKGGNVQYFYIKFMLHGADRPEMYTIYQIITGVPLGVGAIIAYPLARKFGIKNITWVGYLSVLIGSILGWLMPENLYVALISGFLRQVGMIPNAYIFSTLLCFAYDDIEYRSHSRLEGLFGVGLLTAIQNACYAPFAGGYESSILKLGFVDANGVVPNDRVKSFMVLSFYLFDIILAVFYLVLLPFVNVEKMLPTIDAELIRRKREAVEAKGEIWVDPKEQEKAEAEKALQRKESYRIADLKDRCEKKHLDFETENRKYLEKNEQKAAKRRDREEKRHTHSKNR